MAKIDTSQKQPIGVLLHGQNVHGRGIVTRLPKNYGGSRGIRSGGMILGSNSAVPKSYPGNVIGRAYAFYDALGQITPFPGPTSRCAAAIHAYKAEVKWYRPITRARAFIECTGHPGGGGTLAFVVPGAGQIDIDIPHGTGKVKVYKDISGTWISQWNANNPHGDWGAGFGFNPDWIYSLIIIGYYLPPQPSRAGK